MPDTKERKQLFCLDTAGHCLFGKCAMTDKLNPKTNLRIYEARYGEHMCLFSYTVKAIYCPKQFDGDHTSGFDVGLALCERDKVRVLSKWN